MDLCATPAVELARLIRARELSAAELLAAVLARIRSEEHTSELQSPCNIVCRLLLEKKNELFAIFLSSWLVYWNLRPSFNFILSSIYRFCMLSPICASPSLRVNCVSRYSIVMRCYVV